MTNKIYFFILFYSGYTLANDYSPAKVLLLKGKAFYEIQKNKVELHENDDVPIESVVTTEDKSFVKLIFIDKSTVIVSPNSNLKIENYSNNSPGIINLLKGQIRAKVSKDYMENQEKDKSKLFIKTKYAALGVRGTDFQVNLNPENNNT